MDLGNFSISLRVEDILKSKDFYEKLGFQVFGGNLEEKWLILKNGTTIIGLFQDMLDKNLLTFNPGWDHMGNNLEEFTDVRKIQEKLVEAGITPLQSADPQSSGPASLIIEDPDGNQILLDQHR